MKADETTILIGQAMQSRHSQQGSKGGGMRRRRGRELYNFRNSVPCDQKKVGVGVAGVGGGGLTAHCVECVV